MIHHPATTFSHIITTTKRSLTKHATLSRQRAFWVVTAALGTTILGNNVPAPLYPLYQNAWHFSTGVASLIFAVVAVGVVPSLLVFGAASLGLVAATQLVLVFVTLVAMQAGVLALWTAGLQPSWFERMPASRLVTVQQKRRTL